MMVMMIAGWQMERINVEEDMEDPKVQVEMERSTAGVRGVRRRMAGSFSKAYRRQSRSFQGGLSTAAQRVFSGSQAL